MKIEEIENIERIVKLMSENDLTEFKIEAGNVNLCIRRNSGTPVLVQNAPAVIPVQAPAPAQPVPVSAPKEAPAETASAAPSKDKIIESPIVGTFYRSSTPGSDPFVNVGDKIEIDQTICIVEAMKVMNEIKAEKSGVIKEILVENGDPVEFGQPLFVLE